jgi:phenylpropionate dioxygenase-like ring-hydroxylating dioxygenase large terminal subunit
MLFAQPLVVARLADGQVLALEDRCPHRGVALSTGKLCGSVIRCAYHGWAFDAAGHCVATPGTLNNEPIGLIRVPAFSVQERDGLVWVAQSNEQPLPQRIQMMKPERQRFITAMTWQTPILEAQENFLDALHTHLVHPGLVRRDSKRREVNVSTCSEGDGFSVDYQGQSDQTGMLHRLFESRRTRERAYLSGLGVAQIEYQYASGWAAFITLCFSPATADSTRVFALLHIEGRFAPSWLVRALVWPFLRTVARQDARMLKHQSANRNFFPNHKHVVTRMDVVRHRLEAAWSGDSITKFADSSATIYI